MITQSLVIAHFLLLYSDIRGYMGDCFHPYPTTLALEVVKTGRAEPLLRDEIFCELMKQTSSNPSKYVLPSAALPKRA